MTNWIYRLRRGLAYAALPWFRLEIPGWRRLCAPLGLPIGSDVMWGSLPPSTCRGKLHGYRMELRMEDWSERLTFFLGRYYDIELQTLLQAALRPGDTFVDIGANIGMITLMAARCVGSEGRIFSVEPHPGNVKRLRRHIEMNQLNVVTVLPVGFADHEEVLPMQAVAEASGWSTFARRPESSGLTSDAVQVQVRRADDALPENLGTRAFIKIDAEGFECRILDGMRKHLQSHPAVVTELEPELLQSAGSSVVDVHRRMSDAGFQPYIYGLTRRWGQPRLQLRSGPLAADSSGPRDMLWLHPQSPFYEQLREAIE